MKNWTCTQKPNIELGQWSPKGKQSSNGYFLRVYGLCYFSGCNKIWKLGSTHCCRNCGMPWLRSNDLRWGVCKRSQKTMRLFQVDLSLLHTSNRGDFSDLLGHLCYNLPLYRWETQEAKTTQRLNRILDCGASCLPCVPLPDRLIGEYACHARAGTLSPRVSTKSPRMLRMWATPLITVMMRA